MTHFSDSYRTDLLDYDYCGDDHVADAVEMELEASFRDVASWLLALEGVVSDAPPF